MAALTSDWPRHFQLLLWNCWTEFNETWQEARSQCPLPSLCFSGRSQKQDVRLGLWLAETILTSSLKLLNGIQRNLTGSKISTSSTKFVFFGPIGKTRWPPWPLIGWGIFNFSFETAEQNSKKLDRKQDLNVLYQVCVFRGRSINKDVRLGQFLKNVAYCTQVHDMWPFGPLVFLLWTTPLLFDQLLKNFYLGCYLVLFAACCILTTLIYFSSETTERNSTKRYRKQDHACSDTNMTRDPRLISL